jgi:microcompartment protein CcmL/EutN
LVTGTPIFHRLYAKLSCSDATFGEFMSAAIGMVEVEGVAGIIVAADVACKAAEVDLLGWESIGGFTTVFFSGSIGAVTSSLKSAQVAASEIVDHVVAAPLTQPEDICRDYISFPIDANASAPSGALGLLETRGYGAHVTTNDEMVKAAQVEVFNVLTVHNRVVCSMILGEVSAVRSALDVGKELVNGNDYFMCATLITQPLPEVFRAFGPRA